jgi:hypothetical protein
MTRKAQPGTAIRVTLPTFAVLVLRQRASDRNLSMSALVEALILENIMIDEVERMMKESSDFARIAVDWFRDAKAGKR